MLIGEGIQKSSRIKKMIQELVAEVRTTCSQVTHSKNSDPDLEFSYKSLVDDFGHYRGRELFYPYIGSGAGRGPYVELRDGSVKMDLINGIGIHLLGHSHPDLIEAAIWGSLSDVTIQGNLQPNVEYGEISRKLVEIAGRKSRLKHAWVTTSGSMANENALKACRQKTSPARKILAFDAAFAGRTTMMAEITDNPSFKQGLPSYDEILRLPFYDKGNPASGTSALNMLKLHIANNRKNICAFMFEPMQGEGGYNAAPREFFIPLFEECKKAGIPIWADEVQTFCRTGQFFAFETLDIGDYIDVCTVAKTLQTGATLFTGELNPKPGLIAGTFAGASVELRVGLKILEIMDTEAYMGPEGKVIKIHREFIGMLNRLNETSCKGKLQDAGGMGLMVAVTPLDGSKEKVGDLLKRLYANGLIAFNCGRGPFRLRFLIPAVMTKEDIVNAGSIIEKSILEMS